jgi:hypothetical protein
MQFLRFFGIRLIFLANQPLLALRVQGGGKID